MRELAAQNIGIVWAVACAVAVLVALLFLLLRNRSRRKAGTPAFVATRLEEVKEAAPQLDQAALMSAVSAAENGGENERLPGLYLSLAHCRAGAGQVSDAEELLRKSIRGAAGAQQKDVHARARVALGDLAYAGGDLTTACEHWQIARALFFELKQRPDHDAVEGRMLRNGCPTDWVLTDF